MGSRFSGTSTVTSENKTKLKVTGRKVPAAHNSTNIHDIEMKFGSAVDNHKVINLVKFNWQMMSSLGHNDVITVKILDFYEILPIKI